MWTDNFQVYKLDLEKNRRITDQIANIHWIWEKASEFQKKIYFCFTDYAKALIVCITTNCVKLIKRWEYQTTLPAFWETCMHIKKQQLEPTWKDVCCLLCLVAQSCLTLWDPKTVLWQPPLFVEILKARILVWVAMPFSRGSSQPRNQTQGSCIAVQFSTIWATRKAQHWTINWFKLGKE